MTGVKEGETLIHMPLKVHITKGMAETSLITVMNGKVFRGMVKKILHREVLDLSLILTPSNVPENISKGHIWSSENPLLFASNKFYSKLGYFSCSFTGVFLYTYEKSENDHVTNFKILCHYFLRLDLNV